MRRPTSIPPAMACRPLDFLESYVAKSAQECRVYRAPALRPTQYRAQAYRAQAYRAKAILSPSPGVWRLGWKPAAESEPRYTEASHCDQAQATESKPYHPGRARRMWEWERGGSRATGMRPAMLPRYPSHTLGQAGPTTSAHTTQVLKLCQPRKLSREIQAFAAATAQDRTATRTSYRYSGDSPGPGGPGCDDLPYTAPSRGADRSERSAGGGRAGRRP